MFDFKISTKDKGSDARSGVFATPHGKIETPVFMPVGTKASVKTLSQNDLVSLKADIILANTYHLYLRPGEKLIKKAGGLHKWMNWKKPILTDSGGFQVFSLGSEKGLVKISDDNVEFKSYHDGSSHVFTPEKAMQIQHDLGADIMMAFDECAPADSSKNYFREALNRTHNWLLRCKQSHIKYSKKQALFGIVQGGIYEELRSESAKFINDQNLPGNAIGGLSVGESKKDMLNMIEASVPHLAPDKPRYLMGVGTPEDILESVERGIDMFDCVHPTRMSRHGAFWTNEGRFSIRNQKFKFANKPLQKNCHCECCQNYSSSYLRHLIIENEILGMRMLTIHNLYFLLNLMAQIRTEISQGNFQKFKREFLKNFRHKKSE